MELKGQIVFSAGEPTRFDIWTMDLENRTLSQLTEGDYFNDSPKWSPDGTRIVFVSNRTGSPQVWMMNEDGTEQHPLTDTLGYCSDPSWSPGGSKIVFVSSSSEGGGMGLWAQGVEKGKTPELLTPIPGMPTSPCWSPDGRKLILSAPIKGVYSIWEYTISNQNWRQITGGKCEDICPAVSPTGKTIAFVSSRESEVLDTVGDYGAWIVDIDGSNLRRISTGKGQSTHVNWSPDGRFLIYCTSHAGSSTERLKVKDLLKDLAGTLEFSRDDLKRALAEPTQTKAGLMSILGLMPDSLKRMFYDGSFYGTEKQPDWKY